MIRETLNPVAAPSPSTQPRKSHRLWPPVNVDLVEAVGRGIDEVHLARDAVEAMVLLGPGIVPITRQEPTTAVV